MEYASDGLLELLDKKRGPPGERPFRWVWGNLNDSGLWVLLGLFLKD